MLAVPHSPPIPIIRTTYHWTWEQLAVVALVVVVDQYLRTGLGA